MLPAWENFVAINYTNRGARASLIIMIGLLLFDPVVVQAQSDRYASDPDPVYVVIGRMDGVPRTRRNQQQFERMLSEQRDIRVVRSSVFYDAATALGVFNMIPEDARSLEAACDRAEVDVALFVQSEPDGSDSRVIVTAYSANAGKFIGEKVIRVPNARMNREVWAVAAEAIRPDIVSALGKAGPPARARVWDARPAPRVRDRVDARDRRRDRAKSQALKRRINNLPLADEEVEVETSTSNAPIADLRIGAMSLARSFQYTASPSSQIFNEGGIDYNLGLVPGLVVQAQFMPFSRRRGGIKGLGFRFMFEKAFFRTQQTVTNIDLSTETQLLDSNHMHIVGHLTYVHRFAGGGEVGGYLGLGNLVFELAPNDEYSGTNYLYIDAGASGFIPFGTPSIGLAANAGMVPYASMGDTVTEMAGEATVFGYRLYGGLESRLPMGLVLSVGADYTAFLGELTGVGRGGRVGKSSDDGFVTLRFMGGYRF